MKNQISEVLCYYTGGDVYVYSAKYGDAWLYGAFDQTIDCYKVRGEVLFCDDCVCDQYGWTDEMKGLHNLDDDLDEIDPDFVFNDGEYYISPEQIEYPTWQDILDSLRNPDLLIDKLPSEAEDSLVEFNPDLTKHTNEEE